MSRRPSVLSVNLVALAIVLTALLAAAFYMTRPKYALFGQWTDFIDFKVLLLLFAIFNGIVAALIQAEKERVAHFFALLCAPAGIGLAVRHWLQAEVSFAETGDARRDAFGASQAHTMFVGFEYSQSLCYAALGLAGSAAILAILRFRKRESQA